VREQAFLESGFSRSDLHKKPSRGEDFGQKPRILPQVTGAVFHDTMIFQSSKSAKTAYSDTSFTSTFLPFYEHPPLSLGIWCSILLSYGTILVGVLSQGFKSCNQTARRIS